MIFHQCVKPLNAGFVEISAGFCISQSRLSRDLHKDVKDLGCGNSGMAEAAEHSKLFVRAVLLLCATVLWWTACPMRACTSGEQEELGSCSCGGSSLLWVEAAPFPPSWPNSSWGRVSAICLAAQADVSCRPDPAIASQRSCQGSWAV